MHAYVHAALASVRCVCVCLDAHVSPNFSSFFPGEDVWGPPQDWAAIPGWTGFSVGVGWLRPCT